MNKVILVGNLTADPNLSQTTTGVSVCKFSLAVQRPFKNADGNKEADFFSIIVWRALGENCQKYLKKGSKCGVVGSIQTRNYENKDGVKVYVTEIVADEVEFLSAKSEEESTPPLRGQQQSFEKPPRKTVRQLEPVEDDDLPF